MLVYILYTNRELLYIIRVTNNILLLETMNYAFGIGFQQCRVDKLNWFWAISKLKLEMKGLFTHRTEYPYIDCWDVI